MNRLSQFGLRGFQALEGPVAKVDDGKADDLFLFVVKTHNNALADIHAHSFAGFADGDVKHIGFLVVFPTERGFPLENPYDIQI